MKPWQRLLAAVLCTVLFTMSYVTFVYASAPTPEPEDASNDDLGDWLLRLVIPGDDFFEKEMGKLDEKMKAKLPYQTYLSTVGRLKEVSGRLDGDASVLDIKFEYMGMPYTIELSDAIEPFLPKFRGLITGLYVLYAALYNYRQIMHLIRGTNYANMKTGGKAEK